MGRMKSCSVPGRNVSVLQVPAWRRRRAAVRRALSVVLTKGFVTTGLSCCQGETWFLRVKRRDLGLDVRSLDFVLSRPAVCIFSHQSLCAFMLVWRSPLKYLTRVVMEIRPCDDVVLSLKGKLPLRAR